MTRTLSRPKRVAFISLATGLALLLLEGVSFVGLWIADGKPFSWSRLQDKRAEIIERYDFDKGGRLSVGTEVIHPFVGYVLDPDGVEGVSELGYADPDPLSIARSADTVVIAVVGGSVASNLAHRGMDPIVDELGASPVFAGKEIVTLNLAMGGYKQPQQLMTLSYLLALGAEFDIVINVDGFNEVALHGAGNENKDVFPIYPRDWYARVGEMLDSRSRHLMGRIAHVEGRIVAVAETFSAAPLRFSTTASLVWRFRHARLMDRHWQASEKFRAYEPTEKPYLLTGPRIDPGSEAELYDHLAAIWKRSSLQLAQLCRANGIRYYHFLQPNQYVEGSKVLTEEELDVAWMDGQPYRPGVEMGYPALRRAGEEIEALGVQFFDLSGIFADDSRSIYADDCCHYNELGREVLATRIAREILASRS